MQLVVNHLTRMQHGTICVAGVDPATGRHVRPVLRYASLPPAMLPRNGGVFDIGHVVELGTPFPLPQPPHVEDHVFDPWRAALVRHADPEEFWDLLGRFCRPTLRDIFGPDLRPQGQASCGTDFEKGSASLGCLRLERQPRLVLAGGGKYGPSLRLQLDDGEFSVSVPVTDLRLYQADHATPDAAVIAKTARRLQRGEPVVLAVGLTRGYARSDQPESPRIHWVQVNNLHFAGGPVWELDRHHGTR